MSMRFFSYFAFCIRKPSKMIAKNGSEVSKKIENRERRNQKAMNVINEQNVGTKKKQNIAKE